VFNQLVTTPAVSLHDNGQTNVPLSCGRRSAAGDPAQRSQAITAVARRRAEDRAPSTPHTPGGPAVAIIITTRYLEHRWLMKKDAPFEGLPGADGSVAKPQRDRSPIVGAPLALRAPACRLVTFTPTASMPRL
jgi:hypothetical protein